MPWDFRPKPRLVTCPCGAQFSTVSRNAVFCPAVARPAIHGSLNVELQPAAWC
jgi:hypothetical protein